MTFKVLHYLVQFSVLSHLYSISLNFIQFTGKLSFFLLLLYMPFFLAGILFTPPFPFILSLLCTVPYPSPSYSPPTALHCLYQSPYPLHFNCLVTSLHFPPASGHHEAGNYTCLPLSHSQCLTPGPEVFPCSTNVC